MRADLIESDEDILTIGVALPATVPSKLADVAGACLGPETNHAISDLKRRCAEVQAAASITDLRH